MILDAAKDKHSKHFVINTLWHTGARISAASIFLLILYGTLEPG